MKTHTYSVKQILSDEASIAKINQIMDTQPTYLRADIARYLCNEFEFKDARGKPQIASCLKALIELQTKGLIKLPKPVSVHKNKWAPKRLGNPVPFPINVPQSVDKINAISLILIQPQNHQLMKIFNELICSEHPLGNTRVVGRQLRYLIKSEHGWLGAISFGSCALYLEQRDKWIGWKNEDIIRNRDYVVNMNRFLIRNSTNCKNLASFVLARCVKQLPDDYYSRYGYTPLIIETFVDTQSYQGTCYKAANWILVGQTKGRGRNDRNSNFKKSIKDIYLYPLSDHFREKMGLPEKQLPEFQAICPTQGIEKGQWAEQEFGMAELGDKRLTPRLIKIAEDKSLCPGASYLTAANGNRYDIKGYYNFVRSQRELNNFDSILSTHFYRTKQRMKNSECVLVIQDTSELNYSKLNHCKGLGFIGRNQKNTTTLGLKLHSSFVVNTQGLPLGILNSECYAPDPSKVKKKKSEKRNTPISEKESYRWIKGYEACVSASKIMPETQIINVMDREADIYELFEEAERNNKCVDLIVRAQHDRVLVGSENKLFDELRKSRVDFELEVDIPKQRKRKNKQNKRERPYLSARKATLQVHYQQIRLKPPASPILKNRKDIELWAVYAVEQNPPEGAEKISWFLLTTLDISNDDIAVFVIQCYRRRWRIEEWHRVLKTGLGIENYQNRSAERIKRALAIDMVIGWRAMFLTISGRQTPGAPANFFLTIKNAE